MAKTTGDPSKRNYTMTLKPGLMKADLDARILKRQRRMGGDKGATNEIVTELVAKAIDDENRYHEEFRRLSGLVEDLRQDTAELRSQVTGLHEKFGHCLRTLMVAARLVDNTTADQWFDEYYRTNKMNEEG